MLSRLAFSTLLAMPLVTLSAKGQEPAAAVVNGEPIPETALTRALKPVPAEHKDKARKEILNFMIDNVLIDQYVIQQKVGAPTAEVDQRLQQVYQEIKDNKQEPAKVLKELMLTETELRRQIAADLRWDNFVKMKTSDTALAGLLRDHKDWFDGSRVAARHILVAVSPEADAKTREAAKAKLAAIRGEILAKSLQAKKEDQAKALLEAFTEAVKVSDCPSKQTGGDLGVFPRIGTMVEPFAAAAFALQPGQISGIVETNFGYHIILVTSRTPGKAVKLEDLKDEIREVYAERLRTELAPQLRRTAKIEIK